MFEYLKRVINNTAERIVRLKWVHDAIQIAAITYNVHVKPVVDFVAPVFRLIWNFYKWAFMKMSFVNGKLSRRRAGILAVPVLTIFTLFMVETGIPETYDFVVDGVGVLTERQEHVFLTGAGLTGDPTESTFQAKGCLELPCTEDNSTYYHIRPNSVKTLINLFTKGTIYLPEEVEAAIPDQLSECDVTIQWFRWRSFKMYNTLTEVSCLPVAQGKL